jgi:hypothetical protein
MNKSLIALLVTSGLAAAPALAAPADTQFGDPAVDMGPGQIVALNDNLYVVASGGIGDEERSALESQAGRYSTRMTFSESNGQYVVADHVRLFKRGTEVMSVNNAGPLVYAQIPPGQYALTVDYKGVSQTRNITVGAKTGEVHMVWPVSLD